LDTLSLILPIAPDNLFLSDSNKETTLHLS
jgi:hypothetical protein